MKKLFLVTLGLLLAYSGFAQSRGGVTVYFKDANSNSWPVAIPASVRNSDSASVPNAFQNHGMYLGQGYAADSFYTTSSYTSRLITLNYFACGSWHKLDTFFNQNSYYLTLTITLACNPPCYAYFTVSSSGQQLNFLPQQVINGYSHHWDFGNGATSTQVNPGYVYFVPGQYTVTHVVSNTQLGCSDTFSTVISPYIPCTADFTFYGQGLSVDYRSNYHNQNWTHAWNFGDGSTSNAITPTHTYASYGVYTVTHSISGAGCYKTQSYQVYVNNSCEAKFGLIQNPNNINYLQTLDSSTYNASYFIRFNWETDNYKFYSNSPYTNISYSSPGIKTVRLILQNGTCLDTAERMDSVGMDCSRPSIFTQHYSAPYGQDYGILVDFSDQIAGADYAWKWPDNNLAYGPTQVYRSVTQDSITVRLYLNNYLNCLDSFDYRLKLPYDSSLVLDSITYTHPDNSGFFRFIGYSRGFKTGGYIDYGDGTVDSSGFQGIYPTYLQHWYLQAGTYQVKMVVWNSHFRDSMSITVQSQGNQCYFSNPNRPINIYNYPSPSGKVNFSAGINYNYANFISNGVQMKSHWVFGDGDSTDTNNTSVQHTYASNGIYNIKTRFGDSLGLCALGFDTTLVVSNSVNNGNCPAFFSSQAINPSKFKFTPQDTLADVYSWDFGDGSSSSAKFPVHQYTSTGNRVVKLTLYKISLGCTNSSQQIISPNADCNASFYAVQTAPYTFTFRRISTISAYSSTIWNFGDGTIDTTTADSISHTYSSGGNKTVMARGMHPITKALYGNCQYTSSVQMNPCGISGYQFLYGNIIFNDTFHQDYDSLRVYLIAFDTAQGILAAKDSLTIRYSDSGSFYFNTTCINPPLLVKAACLPGSKYFADFIPTYSDSSTQWNNAKQLSNPSSPQSISINMRRGTNPGGPGFIGGYVSQGANKNGAGLDGIQLNLYTLDDVAVAYTYSFNAGRYEFSNLAYGSYKLIVEIPGKTSSIHYVNLSAGNKSVDNLDFEINSQDIGVINHLEVIKASIFQAYPNPTDGSVRIRTTSNYPITWTELRDVNGKLIPIQANTLSDTELVFDLSQLPAGVYLLTAGDDTYLSRIRLVKR